VMPSCPVCSVCAHRQCGELGPIAASRALAVDVRAGPATPLQPSGTRMPMWPADVSGLGRCTPTSKGRVGQRGSVQETPSASRQRRRRSRWPRACWLVSTSGVIGERAGSHPFVGGRGLPRTAGSTARRRRRARARVRGASVCVLSRAHQTPRGHRLAWCGPADVWAR
jgi:hypothetical protein